KLFIISLPPYSYGGDLAYAPVMPYPLTNTSDSKNNLIYRGKIINLAFIAANLQDFLNLTNLIKISQAIFNTFYYIFVINNQVYDFQAFNPFQSG
ncbi:MAG: hypothetical protein ACOX5T_01975, partial [Candidatus Cryptobacteroides sp.]